jgi:hypothetical protein
VLLLLLPLGNALSFDKIKFFPRMTCILQQIPLKMRVLETLFIRSVFNLMEVIHVELQVKSFYLSYERGDVFVSVIFRKNLFREERSVFDYEVIAGVRPTDNIIVSIALHNSGMYL